MQWPPSACTPLFPHFLSVCSHYFSTLKTFPPSIFHQRTNVPQPFLVYEATFAPKNASWTPVQAMYSHRWTLDSDLQWLHPVQEKAMGWWEAMPSSEGDVLLFPTDITCFPRAIPRELAPPSPVGDIRSRNTTVPANRSAPSTVRCSAPYRLWFARRKLKGADFFLAAALVLVELIIQDRCSCSQLFWHSAPPSPIRQACSREA